MKKIISVATLVVLVFVGSALMEASAQTPPAPPATGNPGGTPMGGNAPIGGGAALLIALGAGYAWKKLRNSGEEKI